MIQEMENDRRYSSGIVTEIVPFEKLFPAENYHQDYFATNSTQPYCAYIIAPKLTKIKTKFSDKLK